MLIWLVSFKDFKPEYIMADKVGKKLINCINIFFEKIVFFSRFFYWFKYSDFKICLFMD